MGAGSAAGFCETRLAGLTALTQLGLVEICETGGAKKYAPVPVAQKQDLFSAPILKALEA